MAFSTAGAILAHFGSYLFSVFESVEQECLRGVFCKSVEQECLEMCFTALCHQRVSKEWSQKSLLTRVSKEEPLRRVSHCMFRVFQFQ